MDVSFVVNKISAYDELYKVRVLFLWSVVCADAKVGGFLVIREFMGVFKNIVLVPTVLFFFHPFRRRKNSLERPSYQLAMLGPYRINRYSSRFPECESRTALAYWVVGLVSVSAVRSIYL